MPQFTSDELYSVFCSDRPRALELSADISDEQRSELLRGVTLPGRVHVRRVRGRYLHDLLHCGLPLLAVSPHLQEILTFVARDDIAFQPIESCDKNYTGVNAYQIMGVKGRLTIDRESYNESGMMEMHDRRFSSNAGREMFVVNGTELIVVTHQLAQAITQERPSNTAIINLTLLASIKDVGQFFYLG